jgi:hypothetical protein
MTQVIQGMTQAAEGLMITCLQSIFQNPSVQILDNAQNVLTVDLRAVAADNPPQNPQILVGIEDGPTGWLNEAGMVGPNAAGTASNAFALMPGAKVVFIIDAPLASVRKFLKDRLRWDILTAYAVANGRVIPSYLLRALAGRGISPKRGPLLFDAPIDDPINLDRMRPRPQGMVFSSLLRMNVDLQISWSTPVNPPPQITVNLAPLPPGQELALPPIVLIPPSS